MVGARLEMTPTVEWRFWIWIVGTLSLAERSGSNSMSMFFEDRPEYVQPSVRRKGQEAPVSGICSRAPSC